MEIVCGVDANYAPHLAVMLRSLQTSHPHHPIRVHIIYSGVPDELKQRVEASAPNIAFSWIKAADEQLEGFEGVLLPHISAATYLRLLLVDALPADMSRVLYLDCDLVVDGDLSPLWDIDLGDNICAGVDDTGIVVSSEFAQKFSLSGDGFYFNAGVILFDLVKLRETGVFQEALTILNDPDNTCDYADQDALNIVLWGRCLKLHPRWNFQRRFLYNEHALWKALTASAGIESQRPLIIHYTEDYKPWRNTEWHPGGWLYLRALFATPFRNDILKSGGFKAGDIFKSWSKWTFRRPEMFRV